jgi:2-amino-4-hydroxy-6-hydroxymethyldihydropteridine diphosphokinase
VAEQVYLSLGSNLGDRERNIKEAFTRCGDFLRDLRLSRIHQTAPMYVTDQPFFLNAAAEGRTDIPPAELLAKLHEVEAGLGRDRGRERRMGPRTIDIDILLFGSLVLETPELAIPHPRMLERAFVLVPLLELADDLTDPRTGAPYKDALLRLEG